MEENHTKSKAELLRRYLIFGLSLLIIAFGISIITRSDLGTSPITSVPYVASLNTPLSLGSYFFLFTIILICASSSPKRITSLSLLPLCDFVVPHR